MAQNIEIPVSLGLQNAQSQVANLRKMLQDSVNVKSDAFKDIQRFLDKISGQADALKGKMGEAFKTPSGSKNFLKQYEQLMGMLETAKDKFTNLGLNDIAFSADDQASVDKTVDKIKSLQAEIANLEKGKIGNLFDDKSIQGADKVTAFIEQLKSAGQDVSKITFSGLSTAINRELSAVNTKIQETTERISGFKTQINTLSGTSLDNITTKMEQALTSATDPTKSTFKTEKLIEYRNAVADFYKEWDQLGVQHNAKNDTTGNVSIWLQRESQNIANGAENLKAQLPKCQAALQQLQEIKDNPTLKGDEAKGKVQNIAESLGLTNFNADSFRNYTSAIAELRRKIQEELMRGFTSDKEVDQYAEQMIAHLGQAFENIDINKVINVTNLRNQLKAIFTEAGLDLKDSDLSRIINSLGENMDFSAFMSNAKQAFQDFIKKRQEMVDESEKQNQTLKQQQDDLRTASNTVQIQDNIKTDSIKQKEAEIQKFTQSLQELINKYNEANGTHLKLVDDSQFKNGQSAITSYIDSLTKLQQKQKALSNVQMAVNRWMGFWQVLNMTKSAINEMKQHIQELDTVMTSISVVTNFSQEDLWGQISQYSEIARQYGVAIKGVYEVSQIYYQQGLQQNDVMTLTTETLKMARIAGLDYATAADYMTTAIRGFKLEMTDAAHVTDVFSALAATTASSTEEIATAISKTAASAEAVGASFEATSAMMATMIATTRESATNIGTALKSVISRYGEMTSDPSKTVDSEGEEMSLNRVDKALQTVGITIHDTAGQFRDFDDVMLELMEKWDSLDSLSQRYIATLMAGNRQQSRFLALVSNVDEYKKALETATNAEGTGELQTLKTLDSIDAKIEKMKVTIQEFYTSSGIEELYKNILDSITNIVSAANSLPKAFGKIPVAAVAMGASIISAVKSAIQVILGEIQAGLEMMKGNTQSTMTGLISMMAQGGRQSGEAYRREQEAAMNGSTAGKSGLSKGAVIGGMALRYVGAALSIAGASQTLQGMNAYGASLTHDEDQVAANQVRTGGILGILGSTASGAAMGASFGPYGAIIGGAIGGIKGLVENIATLTSANEMYNVSVAREIELSSKRLEVAKQDQLEAKNTEKQLEQAYTKLKELEEHQYDSVEAQQEYHDYMNQLADSYPAYVEKIDQANNAIIYSGTLEEELAKARELTASATTAAIEAELNKADWQETSVNNFKQGLAGIYGNASDTASLDLEGIANLVRRSFSSDIDNFNNEKFIAGLTEEEAAEYLVKAYAARTPQNIPGYDRKNRTTVGGTLLPSGDFIKTSYRQILNTRDENGLTLLDKIMSDSELNLGAGEDAREAARTQFKSLLTDLLAESEKAGQPVSLATITKNKNIENVDDILSLTDTEFTNAVSAAKQWADSLSKTTTATKQGIETALIDAQAREKVTTQINTLENKQDKVLAEQYENLIAYGMAAKFGKDIDEIDSNQFNEAFTNLSDWIKNNQEAAEALANIDYSEYTSFEELKDSIQNFGDLDDAIESKIKADFDEARTNAVTLYTNQLIGIFGEGKAPSWLTDTDQFTNRTLITIQSDLKKYQSLIEKQQYAQAEAYLNNMKAIYGPKGIGSLSGEEQTKAFDVINDLDLSDPEQLRTAAETFTNMGGNFEKIASQFTNSALRWTTSTATLLEQLASSTQETAKAIESSISDMSKVFKYSEALEKAQALMDANEGVQFDELFTFDKDLGGYIKTAKAFQLEMAEFENKQYEDINRSINDYKNFMPNVSSNALRATYTAGKTSNTRAEQAKRKFADLIGLDRESNTYEQDLDRLWQEYTQMVDEFEAADKDTRGTWNEFVTDHLQKQSTDLAKRLEEIQQIPQKMAQEALQSFDFASVASGKGTAQNKELFKGLIQQASDGRISEEGSNFLWDLLINNEIERFNNVMKSFKLDDLQVSEGQVDRARFEGLTSLYEKIASGDVVWNALTEQEQELLNSVEGVNLTEGASTQQIGTAADNVWAAIIKLIQAGAGTLDEVADMIAGKADKAFKDSNAGKQYNLLTSYKDGFTSQEAATLGLLDKETGELRSEFSDYLEQDSNGNWIAKAGQDAASVIQELARLLGISIDKTTDEYKDAIEEGVNQAITEADKADIGKQRVNAWQSVMSGKVSDRISLANVDDTTKSYMKAAGLISDMNADFVYIQSEEQLNNAIEWMRDKLSDQSFVQGNQQTARYFQQLVSDFEAKTAKNAAFEGIIGEQFNQSAAEALSMALQNTTEYSKVQSLMTEMGFKWDQAAQVWKASAESIEATRSKIRQSFSTGEIDNETYLNLIASLNETAEAISPKTKQDNVLLDMLQNYNNVSEAMRAAFINNFYQYGIKASDFLTKNDNGTYDVNVSALKSFLDSIGFEYDEAAMSQIQAITDSYLSNIQTATTYTTQGASSLTDVEAFKQSYKELVGTELSQDAFAYDTTQNSFVLGASYMQQYIEAQKQKLLSMGYAEDFVNTYVQDQTDNAIRESIALDGFLNAQGSKERNDEANKLIQQIRGLSKYRDIATFASNLTESVELTKQEYDLAILRVLENGGQNAVDLLKKIKPDASQEELEAAFNSQINKLNNVMSQVGDLVAGQFVGTEGKLYEVLRRAGAIDAEADGVVAKGFDMADIYTRIYAEMSNTEGHTTQGLNQVYAKLLTARAQSNLSLKDTLSNAGGMSPDAFANLMDSYELNMEEVLHDNITNIIVDQFGNILIKDFQAFSNYMNEKTDANWNPNDPALKEIYSSYVDAKTNLINQTINDTATATKQLSSVLEAKAGQAVNVSYLGLNDLFDNNENALNEYLAKFGAAYEDGILKIGSETAIPSLVHDIGQKLVQAGKIKSEQLAELEDAVAAMLDNIISLLSNGISGNLNNKDLITVTNWYTSLAKQFPDLAQSLDVVNTADGLKFVESSLANIYELLKRINAEKADAFLDEIIDSKESYQTLTGSLNEFNDARQQEIKQSEKVRQAYDNLNSITSKAVQQGTVTSDYYSRPHVLDDEGNIKTYYSSTYSSDDDKRHIVVTPILPDGTELSQATLDKYAWGFANKEIDLKTKIVDENGKELKYAFEDIYMGTYDTAEAAGAAAEAYHKYHEAILEVTDALDGMNGTLGKTSNMLRDIVQKNMVNPDSMNFMSNKLPDHFQTAVNAWENTSEAINTLTKAEKNGYIGVQDFYNIVQTASSLMEAAGKDFEVAGMNAAQLMQAGAENVKVVDGKLTVDLSSAGMDIIGSVGDLKQNMADGIHELADAEIAIIDAEIQVLEILAAMEQLGDIDVDVDQNGINFEVGDIFDPNGPNGFSQQMYDYTQSLLGLCATSKELEEALKQVKINGESLYSLLNADADTWTKTFGSEENVSKFWQNFSKGIEGWDLEGNLQEQVLNFFKGLDSELNVDLGENGLFHIGVNGSIYSVDFNNEQLMSDAAKVAKQLGIDTQNNLPEKIKDIFNSNPEEISIDENILLKVASGVVTVEYDKKGNISGYKVGGKTYTDKNMAAAVGDLVQAGVKKDLPKADAVLAEGESIKGKIKIGSVEIEVTSDGSGAEYSKEGVTGGPFKDIDALYDAWFQQTDGDPNKEVDRGSVEYKTWKVKQGINLEPVFEVNEREGDINTNEKLRKAVQNYVFPKEGLQIDKDAKSLKVDLGEGMSVEIPRGKLKIDEKTGKVMEESLTSYFQSLTGIDLGLKDTISSAITEALSSITEKLNSLEPGKLSEVGSALAEIAAALADIASKDIEKQIEQIKELQSAAENQDTEIDIPENKKDRVIANAEDIDGSEVENALTNIVHGAAEAVANDGTFKETTGKTGESGGQTLVDKFAKELSNMAEQVQPQLTAAASSLSSKTAIMEEAGKQLGEAVVKGIQEGIVSNVQTISSAIDAIASSINTSLIPVLTQVENLSKQEFNFELGPDTESTAEILATILEILGGITELRTQIIRIQAQGVESARTKLEGLLSVLDAIAEKASIAIGAEVGTASETPEESPKEDTATVPVKYEQKGEKPEPPEGTEVDYIINIIQNGEIPHIYDEMADYIINIIQNGSIPSLHDQHATYVIDYVIRGATAGIKGIMSGLGKGGATGNFGLAKAKGTQTLMGELGPELVVSNGRYFVAGQNGAEMVNLDDDAIVFNHLQTEQLLKNGMSKGRGRAVTNERNAVAFATGNAEGPAMASASAALNALKQLRAMWESLKSASISDLAGAGGGGGGGGGGGDNAKIVDPSIWVDTVERWYNLMQKIAKLEKEITHEEKLRSKLSSDWTANGNHYYASQKRSLEALRDQIDAQEQLNLSREAYYDQRVEALQNQPFGKLIEFDNEGQMRFKEGAMDWLTNLVGFDQNGKANYTDEEKYNILLAAGYGDYMKYDSNGGEIKMDDDNDGEVTDDERQSFYGEATQAFWDKINDYKDATQSLWDSIKEGEDSILQLQADQNELLEEIRENQMAVEDAVLDAIEDMRQREIDALQDERDKLEESTQKYIDGLSDALNREQEMYQNQEDENSLNQQKRRLAILQRSGGSAEDIANLRAEIDSSERERYFNLQQQQIDAIQRASDLEIERMDSQIELMTEALDYQKEYGLLWGNVYEVMEGTAEQITSFITNGNSEFWASSELATQKAINEQLFAAEQWTSYRNDLIAAKAGIDANTSGINANGATAKDIRDNVALMVTMTRRQLADTDYTIFDEAMKAEFGEDYDPNSAYKQLFYDDYMGHGDVTRATATARAKYAADKKAAEDAAAAQAAAAAAAAAAEEHHGGEPEEDKGCPDCAVNCGGACYNACENHCAQGCKGGCKGGCKDTCTNSCVNGPMSNPRGYAGADRNIIGGTPAKHAASGGYVSHGIYELGERGTETVLTASQTKILRDNILSNRPSSLISLLKSYNEGYDGINNSVNGVTPVEDNSTVIEKIELNMEVKQIANDYDARRAGEQALNEMMRIARKTGAANSIRR